MADTSRIWTVQEYTCEWEPVGKPFKVQFPHALSLDNVVKRVAEKLARCEGISSDWGAVDGDVRYLELRPRAGKPVRVTARAEVRVVYTVDRGEVK